MTMKHKKSSIERSQDSLFSKLRKLRECGILKHSINPEDESSDFEILEFYGDSVLYERIAFFLLKTRRFMCPDLLKCINNKNLAHCFDTLHLIDLTSYASTYSSPSSPSSPPSPVLLTKAKADVVEAIIGELAEAIDRGDSAVRDAEAKSVLEELLAFISYNGEKEFFAMGSPALAQTQVNHSSPPRTLHQSTSPQKYSQKSPSPQKPSYSPPKSSPSPLSSTPSPLSSSPSSASSLSPSYVASQQHAKLRIASKQNMYKNNISPNHKASKKQQQQQQQSSSTLSISSVPALPLPSSDIPPVVKPIPHFSILSHSHSPSPSIIQSSPSPSLLQQQKQIITPTPSPVLSLPSPSFYSPSSEVFLGGRNVAVYTAT